MKKIKRPAVTNPVIHTAAAVKSNTKSKSKNTKSTKSSSKAKTPAPAAKKSPLPGGASFPSFQLPSPKSANFAQDSLKKIESVREFCKRCMGYMQRADQMIDGLHGVGNQLHEAGVLPKIFGGKLKDLTGSDWMTLLVALMNSPLSSSFLGGGNPDGGKEGDSDGKEASTETKQLEATPAAAEPSEEKNEKKDKKDKKSKKKD